MGYTAELMEFIKRVEKTRPERVAKKKAGEEFPALTLDQRRDRLEKYHPDFKAGALRELRVGPSKGMAIAQEIADTFEAKSRVDPDSIDFEDDYIIVFACTDNNEVNKNLRLYFKHKKIQVLTSDDRENSDFITSSLLHRGNITIAVNTEGRSPTASKMIIKEAEKILTEELIKKVDLLSSIRQLLLKDKDKSTNEILTISEMEKLSLLSCSDLEEKLKELNKSGE